MARLDWIGYVAAIAACGDDAQPACETDACGAGSSSTADDGGPGGTGATTPGMVTGMDSTGMVTGMDSTGTESEASGSSGAAADSDDTTADTAADGETTDGTTDTGSTGAQGTALYTAIALPGGLDRIRIFKHDLEADRCTWLVLVAPSLPDQFAVTTPDGWSVESISISDVGAACNADDPGMFGAEAASSASGEITFGMLGAVYPCQIGIDVTADFAGMLPGIPGQDALLAADVPVAGC